MEGGREGMSSHQPLAREIVGWGRLKPEFLPDGQDKA